MRGPINPAVRKAVSLWLLCLDSIQNSWFKDLLSPVRHSLQTYEDCSSRSPFYYWSSLSSNTAELQNSSDAGPQSICLDVILDWRQRELLRDSIEFDGKKKVILIFSVCSWPNSPMDQTRFHVPSGSRDTPRSEGRDFSRRSAENFAMTAYNVMQKWNLKFSGARGEDAKTFLLRIEEGCDLVPVSDKERYLTLSIVLFNRYRSIGFEVSAVGCRCGPRLRRHSVRDSGTRVSSSLFAKK